MGRGGQQLTILSKMGKKLRHKLSLVDSDSEIQSGTQFFLF
jgi:hypothetical protein